ncbi:hypothetical protein EDB19DRAFT_537465 [Suillus lakei]|nr:hypothetical protein EDB19DRAFT_537465 [Suillus lakei]
MPSTFRQSYNSGQVTVDSPNGRKLNTPPSYPIDSQIFLSHPYGFPQNHMPEQAESPFFPPPSPHQPHSYPSGSQNPLATFHPYGSSSYPTPGHGIFAPCSPPTFPPQDTSSIVPAHTTSNFHVFPESLSMQEFSDARDELDVYKLPNVQHRYSAMFVSDEKVPTRPVATQAAGKMSPHYTAYMPEQGTPHDSRSTPMSSSTIMSLGALVTGHPNAPYPTTLLDQGQNDDLQVGAFGIYPDPMVFLDSMHTVPGWVHLDFADYDRTQHPSGDTNLEPVSSAPHNTAAPPKRKAPKRKAPKAVKAIGGSSSVRKRRRGGSGSQGMSGKYALADASATVMAEPPTDHLPVCISGRRTHDAEGNALRTRKYGRMKIDDSFCGQSATLAKNLCAGLTCVWACEWTEQPCGLYVEMSKTQVKDHLLHWHGVHDSSIAPCKFEGCSYLSPMKNVSRHITMVHYSVTSACDHCGKGS